MCGLYDLPMRLSRILPLIAVLLAVIAFAGSVMVRTDRTTAPPVVAAKKRPPPVVQYKEFSLPSLPSVPEPPKPKGTVLSDVPFGPPHVLPSVPAIPKPEPAGPFAQARVVIIIDDVGMDIRHSRDVIDLPAGLTLAFLPYAPQTARLAAEAKAKGHELMIHMPMEPMDSALDMGPIALRHDMKPEDFDGMLDKAFSSFDGYTGMNNHMGSRLTQDRPAMARLMPALKARNLFFVDSRTSAQTVAALEAAREGVPYASRDVFLDDDPSVAGVMASLKKLEQVARRTGLAIAIGHPKEGTIAALKSWLPHLKEKNLVLTPVSAAVRTPKSPVPPPG